LAHEATRDVLKDLIYTLITILLDSRLNEVEDGQHITRSVNVTIVKIVEKADATNVLSALIKLLHNTVSIETCSPNFLELVMKCLWKMVRMLPSVINDLNLDRIISDTHQFLKAFPTHTWKERSNEMPLRTIKTLLHSLAKLKGNKVLEHLTLIDNSDHSEVESYLRKMLRANPENTGDSVTTNNSHNGQGELDRKSPRRIPSSVHDSLAEIFKKIGSREHTKEGLNDLYDFKVKYPDADIQPFLAKSSQFFQDYIERGLTNIRTERDTLNSSNSTTGSKPVDSKSVTSVSRDLIDGLSDVNSSTSTGNGVSSNIDDSAAEYMERLKVLRARCGFDNKQPDGQLGSRSTSTSSTDSLLGSKPAESTGIAKPSTKIATVHPTRSNPTDRNDMDDDVVSHQLTVEQSTSNLEELKKRLDKIRNASARS